MRSGMRMASKPPARCRAWTYRTGMATESSFQSLTPPEATAWPATAISARTRPVYVPRPLPPPLPRFGVHRGRWPLALQGGHQVLHGQQPHGVAGLHGGAPQVGDDHRVVQL